MRSPKPDSVTRKALAAKRISKRAQISTDKPKPKASAWWAIAGELICVKLAYVSVLMQLRIYKSKYNDASEPTNDAAPTSTTPEKEKTTKPRSKSRSRSLFGRKRPEIPLPPP